MQLGSLRSEYKQVTEELSVAMTDARMKATSVEGLERQLQEKGDALVKAEEDVERLGVRSLWGGGGGRGNRGERGAGGRGRRQECGGA